MEITLFRLVARDRIVNRNGRIFSCVCVYVTLFGSAESRDFEQTPDKTLLALCGPADLVNDFIFPCRGLFYALAVRLVSEKPVVSSFHIFGVYKLL